MKKAIVVGILFVTVLLSGCWPTLSMHPIYTDETLIFEPALLGSWTSLEGNRTWSFSRNGENGYKLICSSSEFGTTYFDAYLCDIGGTIFLDIYPDNDAIIDSVYADYLMRLHSFYAVEQFDPTLKIVALDSDWLRTYLKNNPSEIDCNMADYSIVFTSSTEELQTFLRKIIKDDAVSFECADAGLFVCMEFVRKPEAYF